MGFEIVGYGASTVCLLKIKILKDTRPAIKQDKLFPAVIIYTHHICSPWVQLSFSCTRDFLPETNTRHNAARQISCSLCPSPQHPFRTSKLFLLSCTSQYPLCGFYINPSRPYWMESQSSSPNISSLGCLKKIKRENTARVS